MITKVYSTLYILCPIPHIFKSSYMSIITVFCILYFRSDSTIVAPYAKFIKERGLYVSPGPYLKDKIFEVVWFVSNCNAINKVMYWLR